MKQHSTPGHAEARHREAWKLLPWYVNGTLEAFELRRVETHVGRCVLCQAELARCRELATAVQAAGAAAWEPSPAHVARLLTRIETLPVPAQTPRLFRHWWERVRTVFASTPLPVRWVCAVQGALMLLLIGRLVWVSPETPKLYPTLSSSSPRANSAKSSPEIRIVFAEDLTERELRAMLSSIGGTITHGPSAVGSYTIAVPPAAPLEEVLEALRQHRKVRLAEPVTVR